MVELPEQEVTLEDLGTWYKMKEELDKLKTNELLLRRRLFRHYFPSPKEGTNTEKLPDGYQLKGTHKIDRKVDEAALATLTATMQEQGIRVDELFVYKPSLSMTGYKELTAEQRLLADQCLIIKPGAPSLAIVEPKATRAKAGDKA